MAGLTLDSGALIAAERANRKFWAVWKEAVLRGVGITIPAGVLAQTWRGNNVVIARLTRACVVEPFDKLAARQVGELLAQSRSSDVIDASVVLSAARRNDAILTSDPQDLGYLAKCLDTPLKIISL